VNQGKIGKEGSYQRSVFLFSRDAENSSRGIVPPSSNSTDEFVAERVSAPALSGKRAPLRVAAKRANALGGNENIAVGICERLLVFLTVLTKTSKQTLLP